MYQRRLSKYRSRLLTSATSSSLRGYSEEDFTFTPEQFSEHLEQTYDLFSEFYYQTELQSFLDYGMKCEVYCGDSLAATIFFIDRDYNLISSARRGETILSGLIVDFYTTDDEMLVDSLLGLILACENDPDLNRAAEIGQLIFYSATTDDYDYHDGITYALGMSSNGQYRMVIKLIPE